MKFLALLLLTACSVTDQQRMTYAAKKEERAIQEAADCPTGYTKVVEWQGVYCMKAVDFDRWLRF